MQTEIELSESHVAQLREMMGHPVEFHWDDWRFHRDDWRWPGPETQTPAGLSGESTSYLMPTGLFGYLRASDDGTRERVYLSHIVGRSPGCHRSTALQVYDDFATYGDNLIIRKLKAMRRKGVEVVLGNGELSGQKIYSGIAAYVRGRMDNAGKMDADAQEQTGIDHWGLGLLGEGLVCPADTLATRYEELQRNKIEYVKCLYKI